MTPPLCPSCGSNWWVEIYMPGFYGGDYWFCRYCSGFNDFQAGAVIAFRLDEPSVPVLPSYAPHLHALVME